MKREEILKNLKNTIDIIIYDEISSSNTIAKGLAQEGAKEYTTVIAKRQTSGRGRLGRSFISNDENGLYMTMILRPKISADKCAIITALASVAVLEAIEDTSKKDAKIKWVNDIYINDKKVCGILTEAKFNSNSTTLDYVACGIGINITPPPNGFDDEIKDIAGAIFEKAPACYKEILCAKIIDNLIYHYNRIEEKSYMSKYKRKSNIIGRDVDVYVGDRIISGFALDITDEAELVVVDATRKTYTFNSGEARVRKKESC